MSAQNPSEQTKNIVTLTLPRDYVHQILDGLDQRLEAWTRTADAWAKTRQEETPNLEECSSALEAHAIAQLYERIIRVITEQVGA